MPLVECPGCSQTLDVETGTGSVLTCPMCKLTFDASRPQAPASALVQIPEMVELPRQTYSQPVIVQNFHNYGQDHYARRERWSGLAIAGFVISLACGYLAPLSLIFSWVAINATGRDRHLRGRGLAIAGLILSLGTLVFWGIIMILFSQGRLGGDGMNDAALDLFRYP